VRVFRAVVEPTANLVTVGVADLFHRCGVRAKPVGDDALGSAILVQLISYAALSGLVAPVLGPPVGGAITHISVGVGSSSSICRSV
jgi:hypothetical protein